jgi:two-component system heavy metal sensor histidine kinase CusS
MFWKSESNTQKFSHPSLIKQLTLMFGSMVFILLSLTAILLYVVLAHNLNYNDAKDAKHELTLIANMLSNNLSNPMALEQEIILEPLTMKKQKYYCRIVSEQGIVTYETPGMTEQFSLGVFPSVNPKTKISKAIFFKASNHRHYVLKSQIATGEDGKRYQIQLAYDTLQHYTSLRKYRLMLFIIILTSFIVCPLLCLVIAKRGLAPLQNLTDAIEKIHVKNLNCPIPVEHWPTELLKLVTAFNDLMVRLEKSFKQLSQFSADLAHELRTPVHSLINQLEITLSKPRTTEEYNSVLLSSLEECTNLGQLIDRLLFLARTENPTTAIEKVDINAATEIANICDFFEAAAEEKHVTFSCEGETIIHADRILFQRALSNLISNALKYTPSGGKIFIKTYSENKKTIIEVQDSGCGISAEHLNNIFDRFYRAEFARSKQTGGHGLGLAIVKNIMDLHGGSVEVTSVVNQGSTFKLIFPG